MFALCSFNNSDKCFLIYGFFINYVFLLLAGGFLFPQSLKQYKDFQNKSASWFLLEYLMVSQAMCPKPGKPSITSNARPAVIPVIIKCHVSMNLTKYSSYRELHGVTARCLFCFMLL